MRVIIFVIACALSALHGAAANPPSKWSPVACEIGWYFNTLNSAGYLFAPQWFMNWINCPLFVRPVMRHCDGVVGIKAGFGKKPPHSLEFMQKMFNDDTEYETLSRENHGHVFYCSKQEGQTQTA